MRLLHTARALVLGLIVLVAGSAQAEIVQNGSFESGVGVSDFFRLQDNSNAIDAWQVLRFDVDYIGSSWAAADGDRSLDLAGAQSGGVMQVLDTVIGQQYSVSFDLAGNPEGTQGEKLMRASVAGNDYDFLFDTTGRSVSDMGWVNESFLFTAVDTSTMLFFRSILMDSQGAALDNVSVLAIAAPEPSTALLLCLGMTGLAIAGRRR